MCRRMTIDCPDRRWAGIVHRIDPPGCGCVDCIVGIYSVPLVEATERELRGCAEGWIDNASGKQLSVVSSVKIS